MIRDNLLENAIDKMREQKVVRINKEKLSKAIDKHQERVRFSAEAIKIIALLKNAGWSNLKIAYRINVSEQTIKMWENGKSKPHLNNLTLLRNLKLEINGEQNA